MASRTVVTSFSSDSDLVVALSNLAAQAANTILANATGASAVPTAFAVSVNHILGRRAGNLVNLADSDVNAITGFDPSVQAEAGVLFTGSYVPGSIPRVNASGGLEWLPPGSPGMQLTVNGGGDDVEWQ